MERMKGLLSNLNIIPAKYEEKSRQLPAKLNIMFYNVLDVDSTLRRD